MDRAYSVLEIKSIDDDQRVICGMATTPTPDRTGDVVEPFGVKFRESIPLFLYHDSKQVVGHVKLGRPTAIGVPFEATIPKVAEAGRLRERVDEAWQMVKYKLIAGVSIGFKPVAEKIERLKSGGLRFIESEILELSLVPIPMNSEATIHTIKALDEDILAASGKTNVSVVRLAQFPGASGKITETKGTKMKTTAELIAGFEAKRAAVAASLTTIMEKSAEAGATLDTEQKTQYDDAASEIKEIDEHLVRLKAHEQNLISTAATVQSSVSRASDGLSDAGSNARGGGVITVKSNLPKGTAFTRYAMAIASGNGDYMRTMEHAKQWHDSTPEVELMIKAAVAVGTTTDATFAGPLALLQPLVDEFLELLRPRTLIGRIPGLRKVPFNVSVPSQTGGGTYQWVGQGAPKPVTSAAFSTISLTFAKASGIIVLTEELVKFSTLSAEATVREEMIQGISQFLDGQFTDPAVAAVANVSPASITNGAATAASTGVTGAAARVDLSAAVAVFVAANIPLDGAVWLMNDSNAFGLGMALNALGQPLFSGVGTNGGTLLGRPVIVSNNVGARIILVHAPSILYADDGGVSIDVSREASVQMDSAPDDPASATTVYVSLWQRNLVGLRAERFITWLRARTGAVRVITTAAPYNGT